MRGLYARRTGRLKVSDTVPGRELSTTGRAANELTSYSNIDAPNTVHSEKPSKKYRRVSNSKSAMVASPSTMAAKRVHGTSRIVAARSSNPKDAPKHRLAMRKFVKLKSTSKFVSRIRNSSGLRVDSIFWGGSVSAE